MKIRIMALLIVLAVSSAAHGGQTTDNPVEVGDVHWSRDFYASLQRSTKEGKPALVLFQEVPGCSGVRQFGREVLTNPVLVRAIENEFIPVLVYNNRSSGSDRELLVRYQEPSWNYQVIRFLDTQGKDVIPRKDRVWTTSTVAKRMIEALMAVGRPVPDYLKDLAQTG
jgi:hypothetical protein